MWRRRLALGGFLIGVVLGGCLINVHPSAHGPFTQFALFSAMPMLVLLSPLLLLFSFGGIFFGNFIGHAIAAVLTWTMLGFLAGATADWRIPGRRRTP